MGEQRRHLIAVSHGWVHVRDDGREDAPAIVLLHETPTDSSSWDRVAPLLAQDWRVLSIDSPGNGASDPFPPGAVTPGMYAEVFGRVLDHLSLEKAVLVGVHTGALFAVYVAVGPWSSRVAGLVLTGLPLYSEEERARRAATPEPEIPAPREDGSHIASVWERVGARTKPLEHRTRVTCQVLLNPQRYRAYEAVFAEDVRPQLADVRCPALFLTVADDSLADAEVEGASLLGCSTVIRIEGQAPAYHTNPSAYAAEVSRFARDCLA